jgi:hypothetical protein
MAKYTLAAALALLAVTLPAIAAQDRAMSCHERCDRRPCQASPAVCERARKTCLATCKD